MKSGLVSILPLFIDDSACKNIKGKIGGMRAINVHIFPFFQHCLH